MGFEFDKNLEEDALLRQAQKNQANDNGIDNFFSKSLSNSSEFDWGSSSSGGSSFGGSSFGGSSFGGSSFGNPSFGNSSFGGSSFGSTPSWDSPFGAGGLSNGMNQQQPPTPQQDFKSRLGIMAIDGSKKLGTFLKELIPYIKRTYSDPHLRKTSFTFLMRYSFMYFIGIWVLTLFMKGVFNGLLGPSAFFLGASVSAYGINLAANWNLYFGDLEQDEDYSQPNENFDSFGNGVSSYQSGYSSDLGLGGSSSSLFGDDFGGGHSNYDEDDFDGEDDFSDEDDFSEEDDFSDEDDFDDYAPSPLVTYNDFVVEPLKPAEVKTVSQEDLNNIVESMETINPELVSRSLLLDKYISMLESGGLKADYMREYPIDHELALKFTSGFNSAQRACRISSDDYVDIISIKERLMTWELSFEKGNMSTAQVKQVGDEFNTLLQVDFKEQFGEDVYCRTRAVADRVDLTIFKGIPAKVFLKDILEANKSFFQDTSNELPVALGFDETGSAILVDASKENSLLLAGEGRSGKSNLGKVIIDQMVALNSPKVVQFLVGDVKGKVSDWMHLNTPHVKRFESDPKGIVDMLNWVIDYEAPRREKIISSVEGALKIQTYNSVKPDERLPYLFVVLDEMLAFKEEVEDKEILSAYRKAQSVIVSKLPAYGIFLMAVPHRITDAIIEKTSSILIPLKIAVKFSKTELNNVFDKDAKGFEYELKNKGDFAYTSSSNKSIRFGHAPLLMEDDISVFRLMGAQRKMWEKLCPEEVETSYYAQVQKTKEQRRLIEQAFGGSLDDNDSWVKFDD